MFSPFIYLIFSYLIGSIPFSFLITWFYKKINVLEVGGKKSSASNVFWNVSPWIGIISGLLDFAKGFFVVWLAHRLGYSEATQVAAGFWAIMGHNWSIFLNFNGGRGLATLAGAIFFFSPKLCLLGVAVFAVVSYLWIGPIAAVLAIAAIFFSSFYLQFRDLVPTLILYTALPMLLRRLSPLSDFQGKDNKLQIALTKLIYEDVNPKPPRILTRWKKWQEKKMPQNYDNVSQQK